MIINLEHTKTEVRAFLNLFASPDTETSIVKNVPLDLLETVKQVVRVAFPGKKIFVKFRGPRQSVGSSSGTCRKCNAKSAAIYFNSKHLDYVRNETGWTRVLKNA